MTNAKEVVPGQVFVHYISGRSSTLSGIQIIPEKTLGLTKGEFILHTGDFTPLRPQSEFCPYCLNEMPAPYGNALCPLALPDLPAAGKRFFDPFLVQSSQGLDRGYTQKLHKRATINYRVHFPCRLDFRISPEFPFGRMCNHTGAHHI